MNELANNLIFNYFKLMHNDMYVGMPQFEIFFFFLNCTINIIVLSQAPRKVLAMPLSIILLWALGFNSFFLAWLVFVFSHLQVMTFKVEKLRSQDDWWRLSVIS